MISRLRIPEGMAAKGLALTIILVRASAVTETSVDTDQNHTAQAHPQDILSTLCLQERE
ncbi:hypothetical protein [Coxiella-like endosymbiont of Rhipicephalus sanguineus]|uniref:hypothetical protein n=1 Tax=Coxiella-like endosymbiont of Rhipicephalus sanguineus TaxID=1955402 RepID=UPI00203C83D8|nr:hypothetical protein [Coxiella-like endosymbiont of Rhipicephalus sanguineus]